MLQTLNRTGAERGSGRSRDEVNRTETLYRRESKVVNSFEDNERREGTGVDVIFCCDDGSNDGNNRSAARAVTLPCVNSVMSTHATPIKVNTNSTSLRRLAVLDHYKRETHH